MLAARVVRLPIARFVNSAKPTTLTASKRLASLVCRYQSGGRASTLRKAKDVTGPTFKERIMAPAGDGAFNTGKGLLAGASVMGLGALCYYGVGMSNQVGAIDKAILWPDVVKQRIKDTYLYFGGSLAFTAGSAVAVLRSPRMMNLMMKTSMMAMIGTLAAMIGSGMVVISIPYQEGFGAKQIAWMVHSGVVGAVIAPLTLLGGPIMMRAALYTAGVVGSLSTLAIYAPSEKFLNMGGSLAMGLGVVFMSSIGTWFLPPTTALGTGFYSVAMYGGLVLFGMLMLYDTQKIIKKAETHPTYAVQPFDPVNAAVSIYLDTISIFIRIAMLLAGGGNRRKQSNMDSCDTFPDI